MRRGHGTLARAPPIADPSFVPTATLTPRQRAALDALCRRILPAAYGPDRPIPDLASEVGARIARADPDTRRRLAVVLDLFEHPLAALVLTGRPTPFSRRSPAAQDAWLAAWETSGSALKRTLFQAVRRLVLATGYAHPAMHPALGFRGPLHRRAPEFAWEGRLSGRPKDAEPIARGATAAAFDGPGPIGPVPGPRRSGTTALRASTARVDAATARPEAVAGAARIPRGVTRGHEVPGDVSIRAEICVIGSGAGGAVLAARLAEAGRDVVLLEEGRFHTTDDFDEDEAALVPRLFADQGLRATDDLSVTLLQGRGVGGGTIVNWMAMLRAPDHVLDEWERVHGTSGMGAADLAPIFDLIEEEVHARVVPDDAHSPANRALLDGARRLGWRARAAHLNAKGCVRAGSCSIGCRYGAKQGALVTYIPRALAAGARLFSDVRAERIELRERAGRAPLKRVHGVVLDPTTGRPRARLAVDAPIVVLAAGAIGTPTLLQRSGLGGGGVGKYLRLHPTSLVNGCYPDEVHPWTGVPLSVVCDEFLGLDGGYGFWIECPAALPGLSAAALPGFGAAHRELASDAGRQASFIVLVRDGADRRRSTGEVWVDPNGRTRIRYRLGETERRSLVAGLQAAARIHLAAGARRAFTFHAPPVFVARDGDVSRIAGASVAPNRVALFSAHVNGTCRIGTDPLTSGCTPDGERHGVPGLYVADGSLFPTGLGVNPQETIMALATVVARRILDRHPGG